MYIYKARFYVDDVSYCTWNFSPFWIRRCGRCMSHHAALENSAVPDYRRDCGVFDVLWRVKGVTFYYDVLLFY